MMNELLQLVLISVVAILFWQWHNYKIYLVDKYRQDLFTVRDRLFNFAAEGGIEFDNPAYIMVRTYLNGSIRYAERLSLLKILISRASANQPTKSFFLNDVENRIKGLTDEQRQIFNKTLNDVTFITVFYVFDKNVFTWSLGALIRTIRHFAKGIKTHKIREWVSKLFRTQYSDAIYYEGEHGTHKLA